MSESIYIAGFDVFKPNAIEIGKKYKDICEKYGFKGLFPLDNKESDSFRIADGNMRLIDMSDYVVANLNSFRGMCMDDGTAFEIGYAVAKNKIVCGYMDDTRSLIEKIGKVDNDGMLVEDFGLPINLMISETTYIEKGNFEDCIRKIATNSIFHT